MAESDTRNSGLPPEIQRDREVERFAKAAKLPPYMWDTLGGLSALARFMDAIRSERGWRPMWELPQVKDRTEMLFRKEWNGRDDKVRATHEVLLVWPDGVLTDHTETVVEPEEMPTHWSALPAERPELGGKP